MPSNEFTFADDAPDSEVSAAAAQIISAMPEPQQHAIDQHESQQAQAQATAERDVDGVAFNAEIHTGSRLKNGRWRMRRSRGSESVIASSRKQNDAPSDDAATSSEAQARAAGVVAAASLVMFGRMFGGDEWNPRKEPVDEMGMLNQAFGDYFVAKGVTDFPPGVALCVAVGMYAAPRFTMPVTQSRVARMRLWFTAKVANWKLAREARKRGITVEDLRREMRLDDAP